MNYSDWAMKELADLPNTKEAYLYKQKVIDSMTKKANELVSTGLSDNDVLNELVIDEFRNIKKGFYSSQSTKKQMKRKARNFNLTILGSAAYVLILLSAFLFISFSTSAWAKTWLILVAGILLPVAGLMFTGAAKIIKRSIIASVLSRAMIIGSVMLVCVTAFLLVMLLTDIPKAWIILIAAIPLSLIVDMAVSFLSKQKTAVLFSTLYIPVIAAFIYLIGGLTALFPWHPSWIIIIASFAVDFLLVFFAVIKKSGKKEIEAPWEEN
ncbi:MAG: hypothetical protein IKJ88_09135 [Clostridia bacterium]|nr:hypothetical protein [Clostridia bacterium]